MMTFNTPDEKEPPENIVGREKILVPSIFSFSTIFSIHLTFSQTNPGFYVSAVRAISPFPIVFSNHLENFLPVSSNLRLSSANSFSLEESKIWPLGKG